MIFLHVCVINSWLHPYSFQIYKFVISFFLKFRNIFFDFFKSDHWCPYAVNTHSSLVFYILFLRFYYSCVVEILQTKEGPKAALAGKQYICTILRLAPDSSSWPALAAHVHIVPCCDRCVGNGVSGAVRCLHRL
jgi:hypothetical protein